MGFPARAGAQPPPAGGVGRIGPVRKFRGPAGLIRLYCADRIGPEQVPVHRVAQVGEQPPALSEPGHDRRAVERHQTGPVAHAVRHRCVRVSHEHLRVIPCHIKIEIRQEPDRVVATDRGDDAVDRRIGECGHEILRPRLGIASKPLGIAQGVGGFGHSDFELSLELSLPGGVDVGKRARPAPGKGDRGYAATRPESLRLDHPDSAATGSAPDRRFRPFSRVPIGV
jgi:hypothetical protein